MIRKRETARIEHAALIISLLAETRTDIISPHDESDAAAPQTPEEALAAPDAEEWKKAMHLELSQIKNYRIWNKRRMPPGTKKTCTNWILRSSLTGGKWQLSSAWN